MTKLSWGTAGKRYYEAGVDHGVLYVNGASGVAWNGLISVNESVSGGEATPYYLDGFKFLNIASVDEYVATIQAFSSPSEFDVCDGTLALSNGLFATHQRRKSFGLCYRTKLGNDVDGPDHGYKIHLVYNALAAPSERDHSTLSDSTEPIEFSWGITTSPSLLTAHRPTAHLVIDSRSINGVFLSFIEDILYGSDTTGPRLPTPQELVTLFNSQTDWLAIGDPFMGGYYAGIIDTVDGNIIAGDSSQTGLRYALIMSPESLESAPLTYKNANTAAPVASRTRWNGLIASASMVGATYPAANYANELAYPNDGASPWYLPAMDELELLYRNFKPGNADNVVAARYASDFPGAAATQGENISSSPQSSGYTTSVPAQSTLALFQTGGAEALDRLYYFSSTENSSIKVWEQTTTASAGSFIANKTDARYVRPVRRLLL